MIFLNVYSFVLDDILHQLPVSLLLCLLTYSIQKANYILFCVTSRLLMGLHAPQTPLEYVSKESASRLAVMEKLAPPRSLISVEFAEVITKAARRCRDSSPSLCE